MRIKRIDLDATEMPAVITVEMTVGEAIALARLTGKLSPDTARERGLVWDDTVATYDALIGSVFNRYWEDGIDGASRGNPT